jgi:hypothetical protein
VFFLGICSVSLADNSEDIAEYSLMSRDLNQVVNFLKKNEIPVDDLFLKDDVEVIYDHILTEIAKTHSQIISYSDQKSKEHIRLLENTYMIFSKGETLGPLLISDVVKRYYLDVVIEYVSAGKLKKTEVDDISKNIEFLTLQAENLLKLVDVQYFLDVDDVVNSTLVDASKIFWVSHNIIQDGNESEPISNYISRNYNKPVNYKNVYKSKDFLAAGWLLMATERVKVVNLGLLSEFIMNNGSVEKMNELGYEYYIEIMGKNKKEKLYPLFSMKPVGYLDLKLTLQSLAQKKFKFWLINIH